MNIVIAGAGDVGFHLAELLAMENQNITLVDMDESLLQYAANHLDVLTVKGDISSLDVLKNANVENAHLFIAVTTFETTNLLAAILAKKLGSKKTIARISNPEYLESSQCENFKNIGVDHLFSPRLLAAQEIERLVHRCSATDLFEFEGGKLSFVGFTADSESSFFGKTCGDLDQINHDFSIRTIAILREGKTIIPDPNEQIRAGDHIYSITNAQDYEIINKYIGKSLKDVKNIMMVGGSSLALYAAQMLEDEFSLSVVIQDDKKCKEFVEKLDNTLVIKGDASNIELLKEEGLESMDVFIALTPNAEINIITSLTAETLGVFKTIALVDNAAYTHISQNIGVETLINKKLIAANNIFRYVRKGKVEAIASLHGVGAEIIEFEIHKNNRVIQHPLRDLHLPKGSLIAGVVRGNEGIIPDGHFQLQRGDKVVIFVMLNCIKIVENIFK